MTCRDLLSGRISVFSTRSAVRSRAIAFTFAASNVQFAVVVDVIC